MFNLLRKLQHRFTVQITERTEITRLTDRSIIFVQGSDCHELLQGITTNDLRKLRDSTLQNQKLKRIALHTLFLTPAGKIISDAFIIKPKIYRNGKVKYPNDELWIDVPAEAKNILKAHIQKYTWKKKVLLIDSEYSDDDQPKLSVYSSWNSCVQTTQQLLGVQIVSADEEKGMNETYGNLMYFDPRGPRFGVRILSCQIDTQFEGHLIERTLQEHQNGFRLLGECSYSIMRNKLPFQFNFDLMKSMSFKKGCYLGQEVLSRAYYTGVVRRRVFPFIIFDNSFHIAENEVLKQPDGEELGTVLAYNNGSGLMLTSYLQRTQQKQCKFMPFTTPSNGIVLSPFNEELVKYVQQIRTKQRSLKDIGI